jgi:Uma2 family endonuclease
MVVEVLSPGTERIDRFEKFEAYKSIPSLLEYGLLTQDVMELELFRRRTDWQREFCQQDNWRGWASRSTCRASTAASTSMTRRRRLAT